MMNAPKTLDELLAEYEPERQAALARDLAQYDSPEAVAKRAAKREAEAAQIEREIAQGFRNPDGSPIEDLDDEDESDDE
jgi:hypothetical protein